MNKNSRFHSLSPEDRQQLLRWCEQHPYHEVVELAARPRPEGLALTTSTSALQRFYATYTPLAYTSEVASQVAEILDERAEIHADTFRNAILHTVESSLLQALMQGKEVAELKSQFRILFNLHRVRLQDWKNQLELDPDKLRNRAQRPRHSSPPEETADFEWIQPDPTPAPKTPPIKTDSAAPQPAPAEPTRPAPTKTAPVPSAPATPPTAPQKTSIVQITLPDTLTALTGDTPFKSRFLSASPAPRRDVPPKKPCNPANPAFPTTSKPTPAVTNK